MAEHDQDGGGIGQDGIEQPNADQGAAQGQGFQDDTSNDTGFGGGSEDDLDEEETLETDEDDDDDLDADDDDTAGADTGLGQSDLGTR